MILLNIWRAFMKKTLPFIAIFALCGVCNVQTGARTHFKLIFLFQLAQEFTEQDLM